MASYQDSIKKRQEEIKKQLREKQQLEQHRSNQQNLLDKANGIRKNIGKLGNTLSKSNNPTISNIGNKMYNYSGQNALNTLKSNTGNAIKTGIQNLGSKLGIGQTANTMASTTGATGSTLGSTAGATSTAAGSGATAGSMATEGAATSSSAAAGGAASGAASASSSVPVIGWIIAAAILAANAARQHGEKKRMEAAQESMQEMASHQQEAFDKKIDAMKNIEAPQLENQNNIALNPQEENSSNNQELANSLINDYKNGLTTGGAASMQDYNPITEYQNKLRQDGYGEDVINGIPQGLNSGYSEIADWIGQYNEGSGKDNPIKIPQTDEEIALARQGQFNIPQNIQEANIRPQVEPTNEQQIASNIFDEFKKGYDENRTTGFKPENWKRTDKSGWNRLGEAFGTTGRFLSNPAVQGALAGTIYGLSTKNPGKAIEYGWNFAQNKAKSDMYNKLITGRDTSPLLGGLGVQDYNAKIEADNKRDKLKYDYYKEDFDQSHKKDELNSKKQNYKHQWEHWDNQDKNAEDKLKIDTWYKGQDLGIKQQNANTNEGRLNETKRHNEAMEKIHTYNINTNTAYRQATLELNNARFEYEKTKSQGLTSAQQLQALDKTLEAQLKLIDNTDFSVTGAKTQEQVDKEKSRQKQDALNEYIERKKKLISGNNSKIPVIPGTNEPQYTELPPLPATKPTKAAIQKATTPVEKKEKGWAF